MNRRPILTLLFVLASLMSQTGCVRMSDGSTIPPEVIAINDSFLRSLPDDPQLHLGARLTPDQRQQTVDQLETVRASLAPGPIGEIKHGVYARGSGSIEGAHRLASQVESGGHYFFVMTSFGTRDDVLTVTDVRFRKLPFDVEARNQFNLEDRSLGALLGLAAGLSSMAFIFWCLRDCYRAKPRFWPIWLFAITVCFPSEFINWGTGQWTPSSFKVVWLGMGISQVGSIHPLIIHVGFPTLALSWFILRSRARLAELVSEEVQSSV
jgi:hypothetical protein